MFNSIAVWHPVILWDLSWWGFPHTLSITDVSLVCWFHLKVFTASNIGRDSRYWNTWTSGGRNSLSGRRSMRTKNKDKELNHRHFIGLRLTDVKLDLLEQGATCLSADQNIWENSCLKSKSIIRLKLVQTWMISENWSVNMERFDRISIRLPNESVSSFV